MLTGSTMIGGSSISLFVGVKDCVSKGLRDLSSLSRFIVRNLLDLRGVSGDELPLARGSVADFARSRIVCF